MPLQVDELTSLLHAEYSPGKVELQTKSMNKNVERLLVSKENPLRGTTELLNWASSFMRS